MPLAKDGKKVCSNPECTAKGAEQDVGEFPARKSASDGLFSWCRTCRAADNAARYASNPEKERARRAALYAANPEKVKANSAKWRCDHPREKLLQASRTHARNAGVRHNLTLENVQWATHCAVLGIELKYGGGVGTGERHPYVPSLDRILAGGDYWNDDRYHNARVISWRANDLRGFGNRGDFRCLVDFWCNGPVVPPDPAASSPITKDIREAFMAKKRSAKAKGIPFGFERPEQLYWPTHCPVYELTELRVNRGKSRKNGDSYSFDRINPDPKIGYVPGNVVIVSDRANRLRNNASPEELRLILADFERYNDHIENLRMYHQQLKAAE